MAITPKDPGILRFVEGAIVSGKLKGHGRHVEGEQIKAEIPLEAVTVQHLLGKAAEDRSFTTTTYRVGDHVLAFADVSQKGLPRDYIVESIVTERRKKSGTIAALAQLQGIDMDGQVNDERWRRELAQPSAPSSKRERSPSPSTETLQLANRRQQKRHIKVQAADLDGDSSLTELSSDMDCDSDQFFSEVLADALELSGIASPKKSKKSKTSKKAKNSTTQNVFQPLETSLEQMDQDAITIEFKPPLSNLHLFKDDFQ
ncbi:hypothetical protein A4X09_0g7236 [Tilletia walkeri]|uniref:Uncharacterized protein n=1 Tax=Tilletia walkeri TaxID=117179 RepID=A0A8X7N2A1_9BASI|nr:hypothetical protein A4X09_0g7236 [Tilletia walkeri]